MSLLLKFVALAAGCALSCCVAQAVVLDWDANNWAAGTLTNSYANDPQIAGNSATWTIGGNTAQLQPEIASPFPMTPVTSQSFQGGLAVPERTLNIAVNFTGQSQAITVGVNFSTEYTLGVQNVSFTIFDIDSATPAAALTRTSFATSRPWT